MTVHVHIERLVVDGTPVGGADEATLRDAVVRGVGESLRGADHSPVRGRVVAARRAALEVADGDADTATGRRLGRRIGEAVRR